MRRRWGRVFRIGSVERDVAEELAYHRERTVEELVEGGATREEAEAEATRRFGDEGRWRRELERLDRGVESRRRLAGAVSALWDVWRSAVRGVVRNPGLTAGIVLTFALGVGANAVMFGVTDRILLSPPSHVVEPGQVKRLMMEKYETYLGRTALTDRMTYMDYAELAAAGSLSGVAAHSARDVVVGHGEAAEEVRAELVTGGFFQLLGARPALGRFFTLAEDASGGPRVVVLGHGYWQRRFGGDAGVLGRTLELADGLYEVIGVAPAGFTGVDLTGADLWLPLHVAAYPGFDGWKTNPYWYWIQVVGRLAPEATVERAEAEATGLHRAGRRDMIDAGDYDADARVVAGPLIAAQGPLASDEANVVKWLAGVSLLVLLIAAFNVANLLLARTAERRREVAVRMALGVSRRRLAAEMLSEAALLALMGAAAALGVAVVGGGGLRRLLLPNVAWGDALTGRLIAFTVAMALVAGVAAMVLPVVQAVRGRVGDALRSARGGIGQGSRARTLLTAAQAALSVLLLAGAGLFVRSLDRVQGLDLGVDAESLLVVEPTGLSDLPAPEHARLMQHAATRVATIPGVESVALSAWSRLFGGTIFGNLRVPGVDSLPQLRSRTPAATLVGSSYLSTLRLQLSRGRWIRDDDVVGSTPVVVINQALSDLVFDGDGLGDCFHVEDGPCLQIVGIVETAAQASPLEQPRPQLYLPLAQQERYPPGTAYVRLADTGEGAIPAIRSAFLNASPAVRYVNMERATDRLMPYLRPWRLGAALFSAFGLLALLVAGIGLYSLLAYEVTRRTPELGIRAALGATRDRIVRSVVGRSLRVVGLGLAVGLAGAWALAPHVEALLYETSPRDALTFGTVIATLLLVSLVAAALPAMRASRVDPNEALRTD